MLPKRRTNKKSHFKQPSVEDARTPFQAWVSRHGYSAADISNILSYSSKYMTYIINGSRRPSVTLAMKIEELTKGEITASMMLGLRKQ